MFLPTLLKNYSKRTIFITILLIIGGVFVLPKVSHAFLGIGEDDILSVIGHIISWFVEILGKLLLVIIDMLIKIFSFNNFLDTKAVEYGWVIVRDISNIFFVVSLLVIAFATVFNVESYHYKKMLPKLVLMAVLVNFSKTICGALIDFSQVIMMTFVHSFENIARGNLTYGLGVDQMLTIIDQAGANNVDYSTKSVVGAYFLALLFIIIAIGVTIVMVIILTFRIIMVWALIVLSPIAYIAAAMPGGSKYSGQWWSEFAKYMIVGPVLAFFFWLSMLVLYRSNAEGIIDIKYYDAANNQILSQTQGQGGGPTLAAAATKISTGPAIFNYIVSISMLIASMIIAQQLGVAGAKAAGNFMGKLQSLGLGFVGGLAAGAIMPLRAAKWGAGKGYEWGSGKLLQKSTQEQSGKFWKPFKYLYKSTWEGFGQRGEEMREQAKKLAGAYGHQLADKIYTNKNVRTPHVELAQSAISEEYEKKFAPLSKEQMMNMSRGIKKLKGFEGEMSRIALLRSAASKGYIDDLMGEFAPELSKLAQEKYGMVPDENGFVPFHNHTLMNEFLYDFLSEKDVGSGEGHQHASAGGMMLMNELEDIAKATKHPEYDGHSDFDAKTGQWKVSAPEVVELNDQGNEEQRYQWDANNKIWAGTNKDGVRVEKTVAQISKLYESQRVMYDNPEQRKHMVNEFRKWGGSRQIAQVAPHPMTTLMYNPTTEETMTGGPVLDMGQETIIRDVSNANVVYDSGYKQPRQKAWKLGNGKDPIYEGGYLLAEKRYAKYLKDEYDRGEAMWMNALYGEDAGGLAARDAGNVRGFKIKLTDKNGKVLKDDKTGEDMVMVLGDPDWEHESQDTRNKNKKYLWSHIHQEAEIKQQENEASKIARVTGFAPPPTRRVVDDNEGQQPKPAAASQNKIINPSTGKPWTNDDVERQDSGPTDNSGGQSGGGGTRPAPAPEPETGPSTAGPTGGGRGSRGSGGGNFDEDIKRLDKDLRLLGDKIGKMNKSGAGYTHGNEAMNVFNNLYSDPNFRLRRIEKILKSQNSKNEFTADELAALAKVDIDQSLRDWKNQLG